MLELGKAGSHGSGRATLPVLSDGVVVALLHASNWKEAATAEVGGRSWAFSRRGRELTGRPAADPEGVARLRAWQRSWWTGRWQVELDGVPVEVATASAWRGTHRYAVAGHPAAESGTTGGWSPRPTLTVHEALPLHSQVFLLWFELVMSRRSAGAAAAAI